LKSKLISYWQATDALFTGWPKKQVSAIRRVALEEGKALGINFDTLEKICMGLACQFGDVLSVANHHKKAKTRRGHRKQQVKR
jgi:hypothetical protein